VTRFAAGAPGHSLYAKLENSRAALARGNIGASNNMLSAFQSEVNAQAGKKISAEDAALLASLANALKR
jgi:hypothetical protein